MSLEIGAKERTGPPKRSEMGPDDTLPPPPVPRLGLGAMARSEASRSCGVAHINSMSQDPPRADGNTRSLETHPDVGPAMGSGRGQLAGRALDG